MDDASSQDVPTQKYPNPLVSVLYYNTTVIPKGIIEPLHFSVPTCNRLLKEGHFLILYKKSKGEVVGKEQLFTKGLLMKVIGKSICIDDNQTFNIVLDDNTDSRTIFTQCMGEIELVDFDPATYITRYVIPRLHVDESKVGGYRTQLLEKMDRVLGKFTKPNTTISDYNSLSSFPDLLNAIFVFLVLNDRLNFNKANGEHRMFLETNDLEKRFNIINEALTDLNFSAGLNSRSVSMKLPTSNIIDKVADSPSESELLVAKINQIANMSEETKKDLIAKTKRLDTDSSSNRSSLAEYLDTLLKIPWDTLSSKDLHVSQVRADLDSTLYGMKDAKERVIEYLATPLRNNGPILCLLGAPGTGKTLFAKSIAKVLGRETATISLGGMDDVTILRGQRRGWVGAEPGQLVKALITTKSMNPVVVLDEIDKITGNRADQIRAALLEILDPNLNLEFKDAYIDIPLDLSKLFFVATANYSSGLPPALRNRLEIINIDPYTPDEKIEIASKFLIPKVLKECQIKNGELMFDQSAVLAVCDCFKTDAGMRRIEQTINKIVRKYNVERVEGKISTLGPYIVGKDNLDRYVKLRPFEISNFDPNSQVIGEVNTLSVLVDSMGSVTGGSRGSLQIRTIPGKGKTTITGSVMEIYKESISVALGYIKTNSKIFGIEPAFFNKNDLLVHAPETSVPKDGPSAGMALVIGMLSAIKNLPVPQNYGITGEVDLNGNALIIGGLKQKIVSCYHVGIKTFVIPQDNKMDYDNDVPEDVKNNITIHFVRDVKDAIRIFFPDFVF